LNESLGENMMDPCHVLKALANGWQAPYPDEAVYKDMLLLKDYRLNDFPKDAESKFSVLPASLREKF
jgi:hypothetical protein